MKLSFHIIFLVFISFSALSNKTTELICYSSVYAPYSFVKENQPTGIDIDIIQVIAKRIDITVSFQIIPWSRLRQEVLSGGVDCAMAFLKNSKYTKSMAFMKSPVTTGKHVLFIEERNKGKFKHLDDFNGFTVAVNRGFKTPTAFNQALTNNKIKKYDVGTDKQSLQMLSVSRVEGVLTDKHVGLFNLQQMRIKNITPLSTSLASTPVFIVFSKELEESGLIEKFDHALLMMKQDGTYQKTLDKYLSTSSMQL